MFYSKKYFTEIKCMDFNVNQWIGIHKWVILIYFSATYNLIYVYVFKAYEIYQNYLIIIKGRRFKPDPISNWYRILIFWYWYPKCEDNLFIKLDQPSSVVPKFILLRNPYTIFQKSQNPHLYTFTRCMHLTKDNILRRLIILKIINTNMLLNFY